VNSRKKLLKIFLLALTLVLFVAYYFYNKESFSRIGDLSLLQAAIILVGQGLILLANVIILSLVVKFFDKKITFSDSARVTAYSSLINFFGFLQGGVGFRAVYLKKYFSIKYRNYVLVTMLQYILLFALAASLIFIGLSFTHSFFTISLVSLVTLIILFLVYLLLIRSNARVVFFIKNKLNGIKFIFSSYKVLLLIGALLLQLLGSFIAYATELHAIGADVTLGGLLIFTGVSQFSIVIALTPGAIGIREALLLVVQSQMMLSTDDIVVASTIDRAIYFIALALLVPIALNARNKIKV